MRIFYSPNSDPMILDNISNLNSIYLELVKFLDGDENNHRINANTSVIKDAWNQRAGDISLILGFL